MGTHVKRTAKQLRDLENLASEFVLVGEGVSGGPQPDATQFVKKLWKQQPRVVMGVGAGLAIGLGVLAGVMIYRARRS